MGFGWLFMGYFAVVFMTMHSFGAWIQLLGYGVTCMALTKLCQYHRSFVWARLGAVLMTAVSAVLSLETLSDFLYESLWTDARFLPETVGVVAGYAEQIAWLIFHGLLLWAIRQIALETEVSKIAVNAVRNFVFICIYELVVIVGMLPVASVQACTKELLLISLVLYFVCVILNLCLFGSCYARICDEGDEDMHRKPSRFAFVNRLREEKERREQKAREEVRAYREERRKRKRGGGRQ